MPNDRRLVSLADAIVMIELGPGVRDRRDAELQLQYGIRVGLIDAWGTVIQSEPASLSAKDETGQAQTRRPTGTGVHLAMIFSAEAWHADEVVEFVNDEIFVRSAGSTIRINDIVVDADDVTDQSDPTFAMVPPPHLYRPQKLPLYRALKRVMSLTGCTRPEAKTALLAALLDGSVTAEGIPETAEDAIVFTRLGPEWWLIEPDWHNSYATMIPLGGTSIEALDVLVSVSTLDQCFRREVPAPDASAADTADQSSIRSGAPGRPTSMHHVEAEFRRRCDDKRVLGSLAREAKELSAWLAQAHPDAPPVTPKTVENRLRDAYRAYQRRL